MTLTLDLADNDAQRLAEKARAAGIDVQTYVERLVRAAATSPPLDEVLRPVREEFHASGMSEDELGDLLEEAKHEMRREHEPGKSNERGTAARRFRLRDFCAALISDSGPAAQCLQLARSGTIRLVVSDYILTEIRELPSKL